MGVVEGIQTVWRAKLEGRARISLFQGQYFLSLSLSGASDYFATKAYRPISYSSFLLKTKGLLVDRYLQGRVLSWAEFATG